MKDENKTRRMKSYQKMKDEIAKVTPADIPTPNNKLRFPVIPSEVEYIQVIKRKENFSVYYENKDVANLTWNQLREKIYNDGAKNLIEQYSYSLKIKDIEFTYTGFIKPLNKLGSKGMDNNNIKNDELEKVKNNIEKLTESINNKKNSDVSIDVLLSSLRTAHASEVNFYVFQLGEKDKIISKLETEIKEQLTELEQQDKTILQLQTAAGNNKYLDAILSMVNRTPATATKLKDDSIPGDLISVLSQVDYKKIDPAQYTQLKTILNAYITNNLPLK